MMNHELGGYGEFETDGFVYRDLVDQITYVMDDAFEAERIQYAVDVAAEFVQIDTRSYIVPLFSVLLTESGGKSDIGTEAIRVLAEPRDKYTSIKEAAETMLEADILAFNTTYYFIDHKLRSGEERHYRVDDKGIYPWQPKLQDITTEDNTSLELDVSIEDFLPRVVTDEQSQVEVDMERLNIAYAKELISKLDKWPITTQN